MSKRTLALALWFLAGWTFGGMLAWALARPELIGPIVGAATVTLVVAITRMSVTGQQTHRA